MKIEAVANLCRPVIEALVASPKVERYNIGFTGQPLLKRAAQYRGIGYRCLVLVADRLIRSEALELEKLLCDIAREADRRSAAYRKFQPNSHGGRHSPSYGGAAFEKAIEQKHGVYVAWWEPGDMQIQSSGTAE